MTVANSDLKPGTMFAPETALYLNTTVRKVGLFRKYGLLKAVRLGRHYCYRKEWCDQFLDEWSGSDISSEEKIRLAIKSKEWKQKHVNKG